jgi:NAD(P)-dependent dehydrogenase (short-subunit alcohol dehydrogenase family)
VLKLEGKVALVTGAGRGIGRGVALALAEEGAAVAVLDMDASTAADTAKLLEAMGARTLALPLDVGQRKNCEAAVAHTVEAFGCLDILVNNAAWTPTPGRLLVDFDDATFARVLDSNLWATFWCMQAAHPHLLIQGGGSIVNFASASGTRGNETQGAYAAAKEGIRGLSRVASREWGPDGIRVNIVCPFANSPGMLDWAALDPEGHEAAIAQIPLRRVGDCHDDIGRVVVFLASEDAAYLTGQTMWVDGGSGSVRS